MIQSAIISGVQWMNHLSVITRRFLAFAVDFFVIAGLMVLVQRLVLQQGWMAEPVNKELLMFAVLPGLFFLNWAAGINGGKRLFRLMIVDVQTGRKAGWHQLLLRAAVFGLLIPLNIAFLLPLFMTRRQQSFHDLLAGTCVVDCALVWPAINNPASAEKTDAGR